MLLYELEAVMMIILFLCRDGLISKDEMMAYFLRANPLLQCKMGPGFIHNFQEMTYLKPTFCEHCAGFVRFYLAHKEILNVLLSFHIRTINNVFWEVSGSMYVLIVCFFI